MPMTGTGCVTLKEAAEHSRASPFASDTSQLYKPGSASLAFAMKRLGALAPSAEPALVAEQLQFIETEEGAVQYEYVVLVTSLTDPIAAVAQHYRDRGDAENIYDEKYLQAFPSSA